jgi:hypothetical protein
MKKYVDGIGYTEVKQTRLEELPRTAIYFVSDDDTNYYIEGCSDVVYAVTQEVTA